MEATLKDLELELWLRRRNSGEIKWETKNGDKISIKNMSDSHLINTINMICRNERKREEKEEWDYFMRSEVLGSMDPMDYID